MHYQYLSLADPTETINRKTSVSTKESPIESMSRTLLTNRGEDIEWRSLSTIRDNILVVRWIALEDLIEVLYRDFEHKDKEDALEFFKERNLWKN